MSNESVSSLVLDVLEHHRKFGKSIVDAYRQGGTRLVGRSFSRVLGERGERLDDLLTSGIGRASDGVEIALDKLYARTSTLVAKVASRVDEMGEHYSPVCLKLMRNVALPGAKIARGMSAKLASRAGKIHLAGATKTAVKSSRKAAAKTRRKAAKTARKAA